jgi:hypothetical protein
MTMAQKEAMQHPIKKDDDGKLTLCGIDVFISNEAREGDMIVVNSLTDKEYEMHKNNLIEYLVPKINKVKPQY